MANMSVPVDGRRQYSFVEMAVAHGVGGVPLERFEQISPSAYVVRGSWPTPKASPTTNSSFSGLAASQAVADADPKSSVAARSVWPNLR
jgi:hypothetical protein